MPAPNNTVTLTVGGTEYAGWTAIHIERSIEQVPGRFILDITERSPGGIAGGIYPGDACELRIGGDLIIKGYVDAYCPSITPYSHSVSISGRSKFADAVDCSALTGNETQQISAPTFKVLCETLLQPFGISVLAPDGDGVAIPQFNVTLGQTPWAVIDEYAKYAQKLVYDDEDGNLVISDLGTIKHASGFEQGINIEQASAKYDHSTRYSEYIAAFSSFNSLAELGSNPVVARYKDATILRHRTKVVISEQSVNGQSLADQRAKWHMARSIARSQAVSITCDRWRDSAGNLWSVNRLARVHIPAFGLFEKEWLIGDVKFTVDAGGTRAELTLMPQDGFRPAPTPIGSVDADLQRGIDQANGTSTPARPGT